MKYRTCSHLSLLLRIPASSLGLLKRAIALLILLTMVVVSIHILHLALLTFRPSIAMIRQNPAQVPSIDIDRTRDAGVRKMLAALLELVDIIPAAAGVTLQVHDAGCTLQVIEAPLAHCEVIPELPGMRRLFPERSRVLDQDAVLGVDVWSAYARIVSIQA